MLLHRRATVVTQASVVRPSSVKPVFSEPVKPINFKFGGKVPFHYISRHFFVVFHNLALLFFKDFCFVFVNMGGYERKNSNDISIKKYITHSLPTFHAYF